MKPTFISLTSAAILLFSSGLFAETPKDITKKEDIVEYERGVAAATSDLKEGNIRYEIIGMLGSTDPELKIRAKKEYNIDVVFHGCIPGPRESYDRGYHDAVIQSLSKKYGFDPVEQLDQNLRKKELTERRTR